MSPQILDRGILGGVKPGSKNSLFGVFADQFAGVKIDLQKDFYSVDVPKWCESNLIWLQRKFSYAYSSEPGIADKMARPYLLAYQRDNIKEKICQKCRQSEFSHTEMNTGLAFLMNTDYTSLIHLFPTEGQGLLFSEQKLGPAVNQSPILNKCLQTATKMKKQFDTSLYIVESSFAEFGGRGPTCDKMIYDEYQTQKPEIEDVFGESLSHSLHKFKTYISTPMSPGTGINRKFAESCQFVWMTKCYHCGKWQELTFPDNIIGFFEKNDRCNYSKVFIGCKYCHKLIDRNSKEYWVNSKWVAQNASMCGISHGYKVTGMMIPWNSAAVILKKYHDMRFVYQFYNEVIGDAYVSVESAITQADFEAICEDAKFEIGMARNVMGVDWGPTESWAVISCKEPGKNKRRIVHMECIKSKEPEKRVIELANMFKCRAVVADENDTSKNMVLEKAFGSGSMHFFACHYMTESKDKLRTSAAAMMPVFSEDAHRVTAPRTAYLKYIIKEVLEKELILPKLDANVQLFITHMLNLVLEKKYFPEEDLTLEFMNRKGPDHLAHANLYCRVAFERMFMRGDTAGLHFISDADLQQWGMGEEEKNAFGLPVIVSGSDSAKGGGKKRAQLLMDAPDNDVFSINQGLNEAWLQKARKDYEKGGKR